VFIYGDLNVNWDCVCFGLGEISSWSYKSDVGSIKRIPDVYNDFSPPPKSQSSSKGSIKFWYLVWCLIDFAVENLMWISVRSQKLINMLIDWFGPVIHLPNQYANKVIAVGCIGNIYQWWITCSISLCKKFIS